MYVSFQLIKKKIVNFPHACYACHGEAMYEETSNVEEIVSIFNSMSNLGTIDDIA